MNGFEPITLDQMNQVKLLDRMDFKYTFNINQLPKVLELARPHYRVFVINDLRYGHYETRYFDTPDYQMYTKHHNGKKNRTKVRFRSYLDSGQSFFEIKNKNNKGRTKKDRIKHGFKDYSIHDKSSDLLIGKTIYQPENLIEAIRVYYNRITLVNKDMTERLTIDFSMNYIHHGDTASYDKLAIAEIKQDKSSGSPFRQIMKEMRIFQGSISKYCLGIATLEPTVKKNNFKVKINHVNKICKAV